MVHEVTLRYGGSETTVAARKVLFDEDCVKLFGLDPYDFPASMFGEIQFKKADDSATISLDSDIKVESETPE